MIITSVQNPRVKQVVALRDRRDRERSGLMRVEGYEELSLALGSGAQPTQVFFCPTLVRSQQQLDLLDDLRQGGAELFEVSDRVFEKMAYREGPDGWLATFPLLNTQLQKLRLPPNPLVIVAEGVEKPGNLGAMLRTADAAGVHAMISAAPLTDWSNPNVVRSSKGALFSVPVAAANTTETIAWLRAHKIAIVAATPQATTIYTDVDLGGSVAVAVGEEKHGLSDIWFKEADIKVKIPMVGQINSLNVATAAALLVYEAVRQRSSGSGHDEF